MKVYAIITGDLINSRKILPEARKNLYNNIQSFLKELKENGWIKKVEQSGGDSFQCEITEIKYALRIGLMIKCFIKAKTSVSFTIAGTTKNKSTEGGLRMAGVRLSIGIGTVDFMKRKLGESDGEAFLLSGEGLEQIKKDYSELILETNNPSLNDELKPIILLLDALIQKYFSRQAEVILQKLQNKKEDQIAAMLDISQSAVNQSARSGKWYAIETAVKNIENKLDKTYA